MFNIVSPHEPEQYRHDSGLCITNESGDVCSYVAWWSDNPLETAKNEARITTVMMEQYNVAVKRQVRNKNGEILFEAALHPMRIKRLQNE